ncbi:hypothetical protein AHAS_Ahas19G0166700 [Arachis hypogaea]
MRGGNTRRGGTRVRDPRVWNREEYHRLESESFSVFVDNLPEDISKKELYHLFCWTGRINDIYLARKRKLGAVYLFAFVRYTMKGGALKAITQMNNMRLREKIVYVGEARFCRQQQVWDRRVQVERRVQQEEERTECRGGKEVTRIPRLEVTTNDKHVSDQHSNGRMKRTEVSIAAENMDCYGWTLGDVIRCEIGSEVGSSFRAGRIQDDTRTFNIIQEWIHISIGASGFDVYVKEVDYEACDAESMMRDQVEWAGINKSSGGGNSQLNEVGAWDLAADLKVFKDNIIGGEEGRSVIDEWPKYQRPSRWGQPKKELGGKEWPTADGFMGSGCVRGSTGLRCAGRSGVPGRVGVPVVSKNADAGTRQAGVLVLHSMRHCPGVPGLEDAAARSDVLVKLGPWMADTREAMAVAKCCDPRSVGARDRDKLESPLVTRAGTLMELDREGRPGIDSSNQSSKPDKVYADPNASGLATWNDARKEVPNGERSMGANMESETGTKAGQGTVEDRIMVLDQMKENEETWALAVESGAILYDEEVDIMAILQAHNEELAVKRKMEKQKEKARRSRPKFQNKVSKTVVK